MQAIALARLNGWWDAEERAAMICSAITNAVLQLGVILGKLDSPEYTTFRDFVRRLVFAEASTDEEDPISREAATGFFARMGGFPDVQ